MLKVKFAAAIIGISSIHLLKTFIDADNDTAKSLMWQILIHITFVLSASAIALTDRLLPSGPRAAARALSRNRARRARA